MWKRCRRQCGKAAGQPSGTETVAAITAPSGETAGLIESIYFPAKREVSPTWFRHPVQGR